MRFLVIDDNPDDRQLAIREIRKGFADAEFVESDGGAGIGAVLEQGGIDLVVADYRLGATDGLSLLGRIKARDPDVPVIILTGTGGEDVAVAAMRGGADDFILKRDRHYARLALSVRASLDRARQQAEARRARRERSVLLGELYHRVNNNLQLLLSLVVSLSLRAESPAMRAELEALATRIHAIALVQHRLYSSGDYAQVDLGAFLGELSSSLVGGHDVALDAAIEPVEVPVSRAIPIGLIGNELMLNAIKHAFPGIAAPRLSVALQRIAPDRAELSVEDNGIGAPAQPASGGFGARLVPALARQADATVVTRAGPGAGTRIAVSFPLA